MKIAICSDLHLDFGDLTIENKENAEVLILAGDICTSSYFESDRTLFHRTDVLIQRYMDFFTDIAVKFPQVIYVLGNHEHYGSDISDPYYTLKKNLSVIPNIHVLEKESLEIDDITFVCGTLWTDCNNEDPLTLENIKFRLADFREITKNNNYFTPEDCVYEHKKTIEYFQKVIDVCEDSKVVVVSHHTPSWQSCHERYKKDRIMNGGFHSELSDFIAHRPQIKLWVHGHTHDSFDYHISDTRVVCNPRGYINYESQALLFDLKYVEV